MKTNLKRILALFLTLALVLPMAAPVLTVGATETETETASQSEYAYEGNFSDSETAVNELPEGWVRHPNFKNGTVYQKDGALYFDTKTASGVNALFYEQNEYSDYMVEADFTMLDRTDDARWMGISYRVDSSEFAINNFAVRYNDWTNINGYYGTKTTGYDGSTVGVGWNTSDEKYFVKQTFSATNYPELLGAGKTTVNMKLVVVGKSITGYLNGVRVLDAVIHNETQASGSFGICTSNANIKVENFKVTDLTQPEPEIQQAYAYEDNFSESETAVNELPEGWIRHPNFKNGTVYQKDGALYFDTKTASGVNALFYEQNEYSDYMVEADFTMLDRTDDARWMGITYRVDSTENAINNFAVRYNDWTNINGYYGNATTGYDGSVVGPGWNVTDDKYFVKQVFSDTNFPELLGAGKTTVNMKLVVVGKNITGYLNGVRVLNAVIHNEIQASGSFGICTSFANIKVENFKVTDLTELNNGTGTSVAHGITLPASGSGKLLAAADLGNYAASTTVSFGSADAATAKIMVAKSGDTELYVNVCKDGTVTVTLGDKTLMQGTATIADTTNVTIDTVYTNGAVKVSVDGTEIGYGFALSNLPGKYGYILDGNSTVNAISLSETNTNVSSVSIQSDLDAVEYNTTPDWSQVKLTLNLSDGSQNQISVTEDMVSGFDPAETGTQTVTVTYIYEGTTYTEKFNVTVKDDPANIPHAKVGIISDVHIGANDSNLPALEEALAYYKNKGVDALVCVGDIGHDKMEYLDTFNEAVQKVFPDGTDDTVKIYVMGNHDTYAFNNAGYSAKTDAHNDAVEDYFTNTLGVDADYGRAGLNYYKIVNGYVFAGLYVQTPVEEREAFIEQLFALPEAQGKPVFLVMHEMPVGSIYIAKEYTNSTCETELHEVLKNYPNAVILGGHEHNPLADERALWQGEYTVISCGALFGPMVESNMYEGGSNNGSFQPGNWDAKSALYMEIKDAGINIERYDFTHDEKLGKDWFIPVNDGVVDRTPYNYDLRTEAAVAPEFAEDAQVTAVPMAESMIKLTFPKAITEYPEMDDIIQSYIIRAYNDDTNALVSQKRVISQHYLGRGLDYETYTVNFSGLDSKTNYRFEVVAVESYQKESQPLVVKADTKAFSTEGMTATFYANFDYAWDSDAFDFYNHKTANPIALKDGALQALASNSSKAIVKDLTFANGTIETLISINNSASNINGGIYLFASAAADEQDTITAYNVHVDSSVGSKDLRLALYSFTGVYAGNLKQVVLTDYFADGNTKAPVKVKVDMTNGVLSAYVDDVCVLSYTVGNRSGSVGLRSHYAGTSFEYIKIFETSTEYVAPDTANLEALFTEAKALLAETEVEGTEGYTGLNPYVTQATYAALETIVNTYDVDLIRAYERHVVQVEAILTDGIARFNAGILQPKKPVAQVGDVEYYTVAEAIAAANGQVVTILADTDEEITISADAIIDLAGCTLTNVTVAEGASLKLVDSAATYEGAVGAATVTGTVKAFAEAEGKSYITVAENGVYAAHCYDVALTHISLAPTSDALGYKAKLYGDAVVQSHVESFGFNLWLSEDNVKTYGKAGTDVVTLRLKGILAAGGGEMNINATAFVTLAVGEETSTKTGTQQTTTMKETLQKVNAAWTDYTEAQQNAVKALCDQYLETVSTWELTNIYPVTEETTPETEETTPAA